VIPICIYICHIMYILYILYHIYICIYYIIYIYYDIFAQPDGIGQRTYFLDHQKCMDIQDWNPGFSMNMDRRFPWIKGDCVSEQFLSGLLIPMVFLESAELWWRQHYWGTSAHITSFWNQPCHDISLV
jgi:hypothetical protein